MPPHPDGQEAGPAEAKAMEPAFVAIPLKTQLAGPLHVSFCIVDAKVFGSLVNVLVSVHPLPMSATLTFCKTEFVNVR